MYFISISFLIRELFLSENNYWTLTVTRRLFQLNLLCAGYDAAQQGSCEGDSGGPLAFFNTTSLKYVLVATGDFLTRYSKNLLKVQKPILPISFCSNIE